MNDKCVKALLEVYAEEAGLSSELTPFLRECSLRNAFLRTPYLMAPMAGVSDAAWRIMARAGGAALTYTEMVSVAGIHYRSDKTWELVYPHEYEPDIAVQLFGSKPEQFAYAAREVYARLGSKLALIDINMACPVPKVTRKGEGSALLDNPELAAKIVSACVDALKGQVPVSVKIRRGIKEGVELAPAFAKRMQDAGAAAVAVHGRYASQLYRGSADYGSIERVVNACDIPVIASGDIVSAHVACDVRAQTGAAASMIARGSYGNPWIFKDARALDQGCALELPSRDLHTRLAAFSLHVRLMQACNVHIARARSLAGFYFKGIPDAAAVRAQAMTCVTADDFLELAARIEKSSL